MESENFLFKVVVDVWSRMMQRTEDQGLARGFGIDRKQIRIHLLKFSNGPFFSLSQFM